MLNMLMEYARIVVQPRVQYVRTEMEETNRCMGHGIMERCPSFDRIQQSLLVES